jgi:hypothetical protein
MHFRWECSSKRYEGGPTSGPIWRLSHLEVVPEQRLLKRLAVDERLGRGLRLTAAVPEPAPARTVQRLRIPWEREEAASDRQCLGITRG